MEGRRLGKLEPEDMHHHNLDEVGSGLSHDLLSQDRFLRDA